jgi:predicted DNA-binding protein (MmcQ/YjbR family)
MAKKAAVARPVGDRMEKLTLERLRTICEALPNVTETISFGHPTFKARGKTFLVLETYKGDLSICVNVGKTLQGAFESHPRFYRTPYIGKHGWVSLKVNAAPLKWIEIKSLVKQSFERVLNAAAT